MTPKICKVCGVVLTPENSRYPKRTDLMCSKDLHKYLNEQYRKSGFKARKKYELKNEKTAKRRRQHVEGINRMRIKYPEKFRARQLAQYAVKKGLLIKKPCFVCGDTKSQKHHEDYSKPLEVIWLCLKHHKERHILLKTSESK